MIKVIPPDAWGDLLPPPEPVKAASTGIGGHDFSVLLKRASHPLALWVKDHPPRPGEVYVHSVAMGSTEKFGCNRNSDQYSDRMLRRDHTTFEKHARWYLNHRNGDPAKSYGVVKKAMYDPELGRVEVVSALNGTKQAAERNGGLVAERTLAKMAGGEDVAVSMSCRVPGDYCSSCNHFARSRAEYCTKEAGCPHGGCRHNLGRVFEDGHHLSVDNRDCTFFDLSDVSDTRGADRTAFVTGKVAGHYAPGGAELAEMMGLVPPEHLLTPEKLAQLRTLRKIAALAPKAQAGLPWAETLAVREKLAAHTPRYSVPSDDAGRWRLLGDLAAAGVVLPPAEWLRVVTGAPADKCAAALAGGVDVEKDLLQRPDLHDLLDGPFDIRLSAKAAYAWMAPTPAARGREAALAVVKAASQVEKAARESPLPPAQRAEVAARYCAYLGAATAPHENSQNFPLLLAAAASHTRPHA